MQELKPLSLAITNFSNSVKGETNAIHRLNVSFVCFRKEPSTNQVNKAVNQEALSKWFGVIPPAILSKADEYAPLLKRLGYNTAQLPPDYTKLLDPLAEETMNL